MKSNIDNRGEEKQEAWYKNPWVLLILIIPLIAIVASVNMFRLASQGSDTAPHHFWQKDGLGIQGEERLLRVAAEKQLEATLNIDKLTGEIDVIINHPIPGSMHLLLTHATLKKRDQNLSLTAIPNSDASLNNNQFRGNLTAALVGKYTFYLFPDTSQANDSNSSNSSNKEDHAKTGWLLKAQMAITEESELPPISLTSQP